CRAPFPETNERNNHNQSDRFIKTAHKQVHIFSDLERLVGSAGHDEVVRQTLLQIVKSDINCFTKLADDFARPHLHCECNGPTAMPLSIGITPGKEIEITRWTVVATGNVYEVS